MTGHARTLADVGRLPLSRRDRAALVLAYECVRDGMIDDACAALLAGGAVSCTIEYALPGRDMGVERARLALLLRVLLRVDAGDLGPVLSSDGYVAMIARMDALGGYVTPRPRTQRMTPLWESAPPTRRQP